MTDIKNSNVNIGGYVGRDMINAVIQGQQITDNQWQVLSKFAAKHEEDSEYAQLREVERLVKEGKTKEAGNIWSGIKWFFDTPVAWGANVAQIAEFVHDMLKKSGGC